MATSTPNYALVKPAYNEWADITVLNNNLDIIDTQIFAKASKTRQIIAGLGLTGGGNLTVDRTIDIVSANAGIVVNSDNIELKPATTSIIGGVKPDGTTTSVDVNGVISTVNRASTSTQIIAGLGLTGGGDLTTDRTLNIVSANDGIIVNPDNIQLNTIDNLTTASSTKPLSATQGKWLKDKKIEDKGLLGTIDLNTLDATSMGVWYQDSDANISIERNYPSDGLQAGYLGVFKSGVIGDSCIQEYVSYYSNKKFRRSYTGNTQTWTAWAECYDSNNPQPLDTQNTLTSTSTTKPLSANMGKVLQDTKLNLTGGTLTGALIGTSAFFSGNVTSENIATNAEIGHSVNSGNYAFSECRIKESDSSENYFRMSSDHNYNLFHYYSSGGLSGTSKAFIIHNKSTGEATFAGGNYGTINGSTATFSGNVTAPSITIGGYVVTIV